MGVADEQIDGEEKREVDGEGRAHVLMDILHLAFVGS